MVRTDEFTNNSLGALLLHRLVFFFLILTDREFNFAKIAFQINPRVHLHGIYVCIYNHLLLAIRLHKITKKKNHSKNDFAARRKRKRLVCFSRDSIRISV